jgi:polyphenol oxidase
VIREIELLRPNWSPPARVLACFTTRNGGVSVGPWSGLNLADHVGDDEGAVNENRRRLAQLALPSMPQWLRQVHGCRVIRAGAELEDSAADAIISGQPGVVCGVLVADCVPILICAADGSEVAAIHAGWRGLEVGVIAAAVRAFSAVPSALLAWIGPAISLPAFRIGEELRNRFVANDSSISDVFSLLHDGWHMDLAELAERQLTTSGVKRVSRANICVHADPGRYYSYRRDGVTGRMAALIWLDPD